MPWFKGISRQNVVALTGLGQVPVVVWSRAIPLQSEMRSALPLLLLLLSQEHEARPPVWRRLILSSRAWAAENHGDLLGEYVEEGVSRGRPYYRQRDSVGKKDWFLYYNGACSAELAGWLVGSTLDECFDGTYMRNPANTGTPPESGWTYWITLHEELSDARRRRIKIALQKEATREVLEGGEALEGWLPD